jgi:hypothetical protein
MGAVVRFTGGWLFDRGMAGWDVTVLTPKDFNARPLRILGARPLDPTGLAPIKRGGPWPQALAVEASLYGTNERVRQLVRDAVDDGVAEVRLWNATSTAGIDRATVPVQHRLSLAALAFKAQALEAADLPTDSIAVTETFRSDRACLRSRTPDPVPAA